MQLRVGHPNKQQCYIGLRCTFMHQLFDGAMFYAAEFELLGQQQEVAAKLEAAQQQLNDAQARADAAAAEGNSAREQLSQVCMQLQQLDVLAGTLFEVLLTYKLQEEYIWGQLSKISACRKAACLLFWNPLLAMLLA
jgi:hypothetical protein